MRPLPLQSQRHRAAVLLVLLMTCGHGRLGRSAPINSFLLWYLLHAHQPLPPHLLQRNTTPPLPFSSLPATIDACHVPLILLPNDTLFWPLWVPQSRPLDIAMQIK